ncbi:hypothetical protein QLX67_01275 [Balneolaceae bacterium ANBcel3]|nr:hypothetical protein [Balneolaceae bacterium ANBcel3]
MANISRLEVFGPSSTLQRMGETMQKETPHVHFYKQSTGEGQNIWVFLYEDDNTAVQSSRCVACILSENSHSVSLELADIGKQNGFRGTQGLEEEPVFDQLLDFILDFSKQYGLTVQKKMED